MGFFRWIGSRPKKLAGYGKKVVAADEIKSGGSFISGLFGRLNKDSGRKETFDNAYARLNLDEEKLSHTYDFYMWRFNIFGFFFGVGLVFFIYYLMQHSLTTLPIFGFMAVCLSQLFSASYRMMQIRYREMLPINFWISNPKEWWAKPFVPLNNKHKLTNKSKTRKNITSIKKSRHKK